jgi:hypothetical protein
LENLDFFKKIIYEAPDDPPDAPPDEAPPAPEPPPEDPPDISDPVEDTGGGEAGGPPPDMPDMGGGDEPPPDMGGEEGGEQQEENPEENLELDEKISAIMNMNLYQRFLGLLDKIGNQLSSIKNNNDILFILSKDSIDIVTSLKKLEENLRLYLANYFQQSNYSKNLLFFNKCLNLLKLLNDSFEKNIKKGLKGIENNN